MATPIRSVGICLKPDSTPAGVAASWLDGRLLVDGRPTAYVCQGRSCSLPAVDPEALAPLDGGGG